ncbi:MAG: hypothetical protein H6509_03630 [Bryobacterales bacterium]|nr:hypothetical protein [Acidobacteriota bacterium]MCB9383681.1 hypothetical protein [Bryobacterales bacterium]
MSARSIWLAGFGALFLGLAVGAVVAAETSFQAQTADRYPSKQSQAGVTVAVRAYHEPAEREKSAFEKTDPWKYGVLPVLVVITNQGDAPIALQNLQARFVQGRGEGVDPTSGDDLQYFNPNGAQPRQKPSYIPGIPGVNRPKVKKGPLAKQEIIDRQFKAPVVAPGQTASGFFYYFVGRDQDPLKGSTIYMSGLKNMQTGQDLFYFEVPLAE